MRKIMAPRLARFLVAKTMSLELSRISLDAGHLILRRPKSAKFCTIFLPTKLDFQIQKAYSKIKIICGS